MSFSNEQLVKRILEETPRCDREKAELLAGNSKNIAPVLFSCLESWVAGEKVEYEYRGVTLSFIMQKENCSYYAALFRMTALIRGLDSPEAYIRRRNYIL